MLSLKPYFVFILTRKAMNNLDPFISENLTELVYVKSPQQVKNMPWKLYTNIMLRKNRKSVQSLHRYNAHI